MSDLIELPTTLADPRAQDRYQREMVALTEDSKSVARLVSQQPDADTLREMLGLVPV